MLVLSRKVGERIIVPDCGLTLTVLAIEGNRVRLGITAPADVAFSGKRSGQARNPGSAARGPLQPKYDRSRAS
jgi:carbon storage regulator